MEDADEAADAEPVDDELDVDADGDVELGALSGFVLVGPLKLVLLAVGEPDDEELTLT